MHSRWRLVFALSVALAPGTTAAYAQQLPRTPDVLDPAGHVRETLAPPPPSVVTTGDTLVMLRVSQAVGFWVDAEGRRHEGSAPSLAETRVPAAQTVRLPLAVQDVPPPLAAVTIDRMTTSAPWGTSYTPYREFRLLGGAVTYSLSDGTSWNSGAGSYTSAFATFDHAVAFGDTIRYYFTPQPDSLVYAQTDYDSGNHSSQGSLVAYSPLVLEALAGSPTAVMRGYVRVRDNDMTWYGEPAFNFFSAIPGSVVPFENTYTNQTGAWTFTSLDAPFSYVSSGWVDFAHPSSTPPLQELTLRGPRQVPAASSTQYGAVARFAGGVLRDVRDRVVWSVTPPQPANVSHGLLVVPALTTPRLDLQLSALFTAGAITRSASQVVTAIGALFDPSPEDWPMFQADAAHTGYRPQLLNPLTFVPRWTRSVGSGMALNPVAAGDGRVFCSLIGYFPAAGTQELVALNALDGSTLWSTGYGSVFSVNPPSYAYGNVYIQSGNHAQDTYLHALDAATGAPIFDAPHSAQWERYYAPTIGHGKVYVDGGSYGGMYRFDAFAGAQDWFNSSLQQYDQWTPALDDSNAYAHMGSYAPGLYVVSRSTGTLRFSIMDPSFSWNGWSMDGAPVVCGNGDVLAVHDGRLICFNIPTHRVSWQVARSFTGQPSVHGGVIYVVDGGVLKGIDELTHADLWSWHPGQASLMGTLIVTGTHLLVSSPTTTYAVSLGSHSSEWSYAAGGALALANHALYIATNTGVLHAIDLGDYPVATTLSMFDAGGEPAGVRLRWRFAQPSEVTLVELQRSNFDTGPWTRVPSEPTELDGAMSVLDPDVSPGGEYWYRLHAQFADGSRTDFAPVRVTASEAMGVNQLRVFGAALPKGPMMIRFGTAGDGNVKLGVLDVSGRMVQALSSGWLARGVRETRWAGAARLRPGVYFVHLDAPGYRATRRVVIIH